MPNLRNLNPDPDPHPNPNPKDLAMKNKQTRRDADVKGRTTEKMHAKMLLDFAAPPPEGPNPNPNKIVLTLKP